MSDIQDRYTISDLDTLRIIADPLRGQILELVGLEQLTVKQIAQKLGLVPSKLYYHVNQMEKHGLIRLVETRMVANLQEKYYRAIALSYDVDPELLAFNTPAGQENLFRLVNSTLNTTRDDILRSLESKLPELVTSPDDPKGKRMMLTRHRANLTAEQADEFFAKLEALLKQFESDDDSKKTAVSNIDYGLTIAFYPSLYYEEE